METYNKLRRREQRFVDELVKGVNKTQAIRNIGIKSKRPDVMGAKFWMREKIKAAYAERRAEATEEAKGTIQEAISAVRNRANGDRTTIQKADGTFVPMADWPQAVKDCVEGIEFYESGKIKSVKLSARNEASRQLLQLHGIGEKHELTGKDGAPLPQAATTIYIIGKDEAKQIGEKLDREV